MRSQLGDAAFIERLEALTGRRLARRKPGRNPGAEPETLKLLQAPGLRERMDNVPRYFRTYEIGHQRLDRGGGRGTLRCEVEESKMCFRCIRGATFNSGTIDLGLVVGTRVWRLGSKSNRAFW